MKKKKDTKLDDNQSVVNAVMQSKREADTAKLSRMIQNRTNFDTYHLKEDFSHKLKGQSQEFLPKQFMAVEQITNFVCQGLMDLGYEWYTFDFIGDDSSEPKIIRAEDTKALLDRQLEKAKYYVAIGDALKLALLGSLSVIKVSTEWTDRPQYVVRKKLNKKTNRHEDTLYRKKNKSLQLKYSVVTPREWFPDPTGRGMYFIERLEMDFHQVKAMARTKDNPDGIFDPEIVDAVHADHSTTPPDEAYRARETGQNVTSSAYRKRVQIDEFWGTLIDVDGNIIMENCVCAVANERYLIRPPEPNPFWHKRLPYVPVSLVRVPKSTWHKALMDAPTQLNLALNELFNLSLDNGIMAVYGIKEIRMDWLEDPAQVNDGVKPGQTIRVNSMCPPNAHAIDRVDTATTNPESFQMYNLLNGELQQSSMTNDLRLGVMPQRQVKATEIVAAEQSITGMLNGMAKILETDVIKPVLELSWMTAIQHIDDFDQAEVISLLGAQRAGMIKAMSPQKRFAETVNGMAFEVFGLSYTLARTKDFQKWGQLLQVLGGSPVLFQEFARDYSIEKLIRQIIKSLDINPRQIKIDPLDAAKNAIANQPPQAPNSTPGSVAPNSMSQVAQPNSVNSGGGPQPNPVASASQPSTGLPNSKATEMLKRPLGQ